MSDDDPILKRTKARLETARAERRQFEPLLDDCIRLGLPGARRFNQHTVGEDIASEIYDDTGPVALSEYASRMEAGVVPSDQRWVELEAGVEIPQAERTAVNRDLAEIQEYLFDQVWASNFTSEVHPAFVNVGISTGSLVVEEGPHSLLHHTALPLTETFFSEDAWGALTSVFRERETKAAHLEHMFPLGDFSADLERLMNDEADRPVKLHEAWWTDPRAGKGEEATRKITWADAGGDAHKIEDRTDVGDGSHPVIAFRTGKAAGESWGRGQFMTVLPSVRTLNQVFELMLQSAALQLVPMFHVDDTDIINPDTIRIEPGAVLPRRSGARGLEKIEMGGGDIRIADVFQQIEGAKIRRGMFNDMLSDPNKTPATATEVAERMADLAHRLSAAFGRLHYEFLAPYVRRALWLAVKKGHIELPTFRGRAIRIRAVSPIARAIGQRDVQQLMQYHSITAALLGPQVATAQYDEEAMFAFLRDRLSQHERNFVPLEQLMQKAAALTAAQTMGVPAGGAQPGPLQMAA